MPRTIGTRSPSGPTRVSPCGSRGEAVPGETNGTIVDVTSLASRRSGHWYVLQSRSEEHTSELQSRLHLVCRLLLEKKKKKHITQTTHATHNNPTKHHA